MSYSNIAVAMTSNEKDFISAVINSITGITERIRRTSNTSTCEDVYDSNSGTPTFTLEVDQNWELVFTRIGSLPESSAGYTYTQKKLITGDTVGPFEITTTYGGASPTDVTAEHIFKYTLAVNDTALWLAFGSFNSDPLQSSITDILSIIGTVNAATGGYGTYETRANTYPLIFSDGQSGTLTNRLTYIYDAYDNTDVEIIRNKVALSRSQNNLRTKTVQGIYDCSTLPIFNTPLTIGSERYFAFNANTIMPI